MKLSLGYQVLIAVILGAFVGLFFGPLTASLKPIGEIYTMLLQMAVLPYICFSLIHGLGSITPSIGKRIFKCGWPFLLLLWILTFIIVFLLVYLIPDATPPLIKVTESGGLDAQFSKNILQFLIPQFPLYDFTHNVTPAIAIFGLIGGIALMHIEKKEPLIGMIERTNQTIEKILEWLGILSPLAAFIYLSVGFGNIHFEDLYKIELYASAFVGTSLLITFWILPVVLMSFTDMSYKEAVSAFRYVCLLPFVTGLSTAALPFINIYLKKLSQKHATQARFRETSQTVMPIAYSFGNIGHAITFFFIIFLGYYFRHPFLGTEKIYLAILTIPLSIGAATNNINSVLFLIKQLGLPPAAIDFYLEIKPITHNFQVLMSIAGVLTLIILTVYANYGLLRVKWTHFTVRIGSTIVLLAVGVLFSASLIHVQDNYNNFYMQNKISDVITNPVQAQIFTEEPPNASETTNQEPGILKHIIETNTLRVGYNTNSIPYCYLNRWNDLVGYDIAYAYQLARDLDCKLEFIPFDFPRLSRDIQEGYFDIAMSSVIMNEERILELDFTQPYAEENNVLIVPEKKKNQFLKLDEVIDMKEIRIGGIGAQILIVKRHFPNAIPVAIEDQDDILEGKVDLIVGSETTAFVWCLSHPEFVAIDYGNRLGKNYFAYAFKQNSIDFRLFINNWLTLKEQSGFKKNMTNYWFEGISPKQRAPRWSILHNVLHY